jgi:methyltransferase family protein
LASGRARTGRQQLIVLRGGGPRGFFVPTVDQNLRAWDVEYGWPDAGEEWSKLWGGSEAQWFDTLLPRIRQFLPANRILEIAPGHGRWTRFLKDWCSHLVVVDLSANCIEACRNTLLSCSHITYHVNDGRSLHMIDDRSIDLAFSFDSLVHAEADVVGSYLEGLAAKLKPNGVGFIHHSHLGSYSRSFALMRKLPHRLRSGLEEIGLLPHDHWRAHSMSAELFEKLCGSVGLVCIGQELVNWNSRIAIDAFSLFTPERSVWSRPNRVLRNMRFMQEAENARRLAQHYSLCSHGRSTGR